MNSSNRQVNISNKKSINLLPMRSELDIETFGLSKVYIILFLEYGCEFPQEKTVMKMTQ